MHKMTNRFRLSCVKSAYLTVAHRLSPVELLLGEEETQPPTQSPFRLLLWRSSGGTHRKLTASSSSKKPRRPGGIHGGLV